MSANPPRRRITTLALTLAGAAACILGGAGTAAASASGCTYTDFPTNYVCHNVNGKGLHLDSVDIIRAKWSGSAIRDYQALVTVQEPDGDRYEFWSPAYHKKKFGRVVITLTFDHYFDHNSKICSSFLEGGAIQDTVCNKIHK
ncbi:MAG: hypothetical protein QOK40_2804 [Miltoncostaeaceae bacterium]|jgi:hypothetical protein|nr:hypothetical protein [Miltoncostaeaceae bacterium]